MIVISIFVNYVKVLFCFVCFCYVQLLLIFDQKHFSQQNVLCSQIYLFLFF